jgi:hypothetical protein
MFSFMPRNQKFSTGQVCLYYTLAVKFLIVSPVRLVREQEVFQF